MQRCTIQANWDEEASVWYVVESDVPGLVAEGDSLEELLEKIKGLLPDLVHLNRHLLGELPASLSIHLIAERSEVVDIRR